MVPGPEGLPGLASPGLWVIPTLGSALGFLWVGSVEGVGFCAGVGFCSAVGVWTAAGFGAAVGTGLAAGALVEDVVEALGFEGPPSAGPEGLALHARAAEFSTRRASSIEVAFLLAMALR